MPPMTARCADDLLAMVPITLGFTPTRSVAMLTFGATHAFHARVDLPRRRDEVPELVECLVEPATRNGVRRVVLIVYSDDEVMAKRVWRGLRDGFRGAGIAVLEAIRADGRRWFPLLGGDRLAADLGVPYDISSHPFLVQAVLTGRVTLSDRDELAGTLRPVPARVAEVAAALEGEPPRWGEGDVPAVEVLLREGEWTELLVEHLVGQGRAPEADDAARLLRALGLLRVRDAAWQVVTSGHADDHVAWWTDLLRRTPADLAAPVATLLAWSAWLAGHGALAWCALDVALRVDPDDELPDELPDELADELAGEPSDELAAELAHLLTQAVPPTVWARERTRRSWRAGLHGAA